MSILKIARMGHPVLRRPALPVADPAAPEIARLVADMCDTLADSGGVGLAAPQVHVPLRVILFHVPASRGNPALDPGVNGDGSIPLTVLVNPQIDILGQQEETEVEGCLSLPGMAGPVPRILHIRYRGLALSGDLVEREARGFHARVVQHEADHLDGILYPQRMADLARFGYVEELKKG